MTRLSFGDVLKKEDLERREVTVPEWNGSVLLRAMRADERSDLERLFTKKRPTDDPASFRAELLYRTMINDDGTPWVTREQLQELMRKSASAIETIFEASAEMNGFRKRDLEDMEKN